MALIFRASSCTICEASYTSFHRIQFCFLALFDLIWTPLGGTPMRSFKAPSRYSVRRPKNITCILC